MKDSGGLLLILGGAALLYFFWSQSQTAVTVGTQANPVLPVINTAIQPVDLNAGALSANYGPQATNTAGMTGGLNLP